MSGDKKEVRGRYVAPHLRAGGRTKVTPLKMDDDSVIAAAGSRQSASRPRPGGRYSLPGTFEPALAHVRHGPVHGRGQHHHARGSSDPRHTHPPEHGPSQFDPSSERCPPPVSGSHSRSRGRGTIRGGAVARGRGAHSRGGAATAAASGSGAWFTPEGGGGTKDRYSSYGRGSAEHRPAAGGRVVAAAAPGFGTGHVHSRGGGYQTRGAGHVTRGGGYRHPHESARFADTGTVERGERHLAQKQQKTTESPSFQSYTTSPSGRRLPSSLGSPKAAKSKMADRTLGEWRRTPKTEAVTDASLLTETFAQFDLDNDSSVEKGKGQMRAGSSSPPIAKARVKSKRFGDMFAAEEMKRSKSSGSRTPPTGSRTPTGRCERFQQPPPGESDVRFSAIGVERAVVHTHTHTRGIGETPPIASRSVSDPSSAPFVKKSSPLYGPYTVLQQTQSQTDEIGQMQKQLATDALMLPPLPLETGFEEVTSGSVTLVTPVIGRASDGGVLSPLAASGRASATPPIGLPVSSRYSRKYGETSPTLKSATPKSASVEFESGNGSVARRGSAGAARRSGRRRGAGTKTAMHRVATLSATGVAKSSEAMSKASMAAVWKPKGSKKKSGKSEPEFPEPYTMALPMPKAKAIGAQVADGRVAAAGKGKGLRGKAPMHWASALKKEKEIIAGKRSSATVPMPPCFDQWPAVGSSKGMRPPIAGDLAKGSGVQRSGSDPAVGAAVRRKPPLPSAATRGRGVRRATGARYYSGDVRRQQLSEDSMRSSALGRGRVGDDRRTDTRVPVDSSSATGARSYASRSGKSKTSASAAALESTTTPLSGSRQMHLKGTVLRAFNVSAADLKQTMIDFKMTSMAVVTTANGRLFVVFRTQKYALSILRRFKHDTIVFESIEDEDISEVLRLLGEPAPGRVRVDTTVAQRMVRHHLADST